MERNDVVRLAASAAALLAVGVWLGGLLVLGAVVAPIVFREVPAPSSADAMTLVFVTFDKIAISAAAIVGVAEVVRFRAAQKAIGRVDVARLVVIATAGTLAIVQGTLLSPAIVALHRDGAIRGLGADGERLERIHAWSERCGKTESFLLIVLVILLAHAISSSPSPPSPSPRRAH